MATVDMDMLKKKRKVQRSTFTKLCTSIEALLIDDAVENTQLEVSGGMLENKFKALQETGKDIFKELLIDQNQTEDELEKELDTCDKYIKKYGKIKAEIRILVDKQPTQNFQLMTTIPVTTQVKLPKIELVKFDGNMKNWLVFWGQFKKIDEDTNFSPEDKYQYLTQATIPESKARILVESYPANSYVEAIEALKERFGDKDLITEVYIRELIQLILNSSSIQQNCQLSLLYDPLASHIRSLDLLGVKKNNCAVVKGLLRKVLGKASLKYEELSNIYLTLYDMQPVDY